MFIYAENGEQRLRNISEEWRPSIRSALWIDWLRSMEWLALDRWLYMDQIAMNLGRRSIERRQWIAFLCIGLRLDKRKWHDLRDQRQWLWTIPIILTIESLCFWSDLRIGVYQIEMESWTTEIDWWMPKWWAQIGTVNIVGCFGITSVYTKCHPSGESEQEHICVRLRPAWPNTVQAAK